MDCSAWLQSVLVLHSTHCFCPLELAGSRQVALWVNLDSLEHEHGIRFSGGNIDIVIIPKL